MRHLNPDMEYTETPTCATCGGVGSFIVPMTDRQKLAVARMLREAVYNVQAINDLMSGTFVAPCPTCGDWRVS